MSSRHLLWVDLVRTARTARVRHGPLSFDAAKVFRIQRCREGRPAGCVPPRGHQGQRTHMRQLTAATVKECIPIRPFRSGFSQGTQTTPQEDPDGPPESEAS